MAEGGGEGQTIGAHGGTPDVFLSYASRDSAVAEAVCDALEHAGVTCWIAPRDVTPGTFYANEIVHAIDAAKAIVLILSRNAATSPHVLREVERAASKRLPVVSLRIDQAPLPAGLEYFLNTSQWLDASAGDMVRAMPKLVAAVRLAIEKPATPAAIAATTSSGTLSRASYPAGGNRSLRRIAIVAGFLVAVAIAGFAAYRSWLPTRRAVAPPAPTVTASTPVAAPEASAIPDQSVAVLPFVDMSEKKDQEYFADGKAEEVRNLLAKIPGLLVIGRTSSFQFKGATQDLRAIGAKLGAGYVVEGSVRRTQERVRVTAQLIDARDGTHRWSETYDRPAGDMLQMQEEIATTLARALEVSVGADRQQSRRRSHNAAAYDLYLRGRNAYEQLSVDGLAAAATYLQQALDLDPNFIDAAVALAETYYYQGNGSQVPARVAYEKARRAAEIALKIDPSIGLAHAILGAVHSDYDRDWVAADLEFKQALALTPGDGVVLKLTAVLPFALGQLAAARRIYNQSLAYDPLSADTYWLLSSVELRSGRWAEAEAAARRTIEIAPAYGWGHAEVGFALLMRGEREAALAEMKRETDPLARLKGLALVYHALGRKDDSNAALRQLTTEGADMHALEIADVYSYRGERNEALKWLDRSYAQRESALILITGDPFLKNLESDPRFKVFLRTLKLPE